MWGVGIDRAKENITETTKKNVWGVTRPQNKDVLDKKGNVQMPKFQRNNILQHHNMRHQICL